MPVEHDGTLRILASDLGRQLEELCSRDQAARLHLEELLHGQPWVAEVGVVPITQRSRHARLARNPPGLSLTNCPFHLVPSE